MKSFLPNVRHGELVASKLTFEIVDRWKLSGDVLVLNSLSVKYGGTRKTLPTL